MELKNLYEFDQFINEAKNQYQIFINDKPLEVDGKITNYPEYGKATEEFQKISVEGKEGDKIEIIKVKGVKGEDSKEVKKTKIIGSSKKPKKEVDLDKEYKECLKDLLELFYQPVKNVKHDQLIIGKDIKVSFDVTPRDYKHMATGISIDAILREYTFGVSSKKPFILKVKEIIDENGIKIDHKNFDILKKKKDPSIEEKKSLELFKQADKLITAKEGDSVGKFKINFIIKFEDNPNYGKTEDKSIRKEKKGDLSALSIKQLKSKIKSDNYTKEEKEKMVDELESRGEDVENIDF